MKQRNLIAHFRLLTVFFLLSRAGQVVSAAEAAAKNTPEALSGAVAATPVAPPVDDRETASAGETAEAPSSDAKLPRNTEEQTVISRFRLVGGVDFGQFSKDGNSAAGLGPSLAVSYAFSDRWSVGVSAVELFGLSSGISTLYTKFGVSFTFAVTGRLMRTQEMLTMDDHPFFRAKESDSGGLRLQVRGTQYFFTGSSTIYPFAGFGAAISYEFPTDKSYSYQVGVGIDRVSNSDATIYPVTAQFAVLFWL